MLQNAPTVITQSDDKNFEKIVNPPKKTKSELIKIGADNKKAPKKLFGSVLLYESYFVIKLRVFSLPISVSLKTNVATTVDDTKNNAENK